MPNKPRLLLLDADVVLAAHEMGVWEDLKQKYEIGVPSTIVHEARYFKSTKGNKGIHLQKQIDNGEIKCLEATAVEMGEAFKHFSAAFLAGIDDGEKEGITIIHCGRFPEWSFCTGDQNGIEAIGMLDLGSHSVAFEEVVVAAKNTAQKVRRNFTSQRHREAVARGKSRRLTLEYFKSSPLK